MSPLRRVSLEAAVGYMHVRGRARRGDPVAATVPCDHIVAVEMRHHSVYLPDPRVLNAVARFALDELTDLREGPITRGSCRAVPPCCYLLLNQFPRIEEYQ
jgi:hypothetical protein